MTRDSDAPLRAPLMRGAGAALTLALATLSASKVHAQTPATLLRVAQARDTTAFDSNVVGVIKAYPTTLTAQSFYAYGAPVANSFNGPVVLTNDRVHLFFVDASDGLAAFGVYDRPGNSDGGSIQLQRAIRPRAGSVQNLGGIDLENNFCFYNFFFTGSGDRYTHFQRQQWGGSDTDGWIERLNRSALTDFRVALVATPAVFCEGLSPYCGDRALYSGLNSMAALSSDGSVIGLGLDQRVVQFRIVGSCELTVWPSQQAVCAGGAIKLSARPNAEGTATFAWFKGATPITAATPRATIVTSADGLESTLTITGATAADAGTYNCRTTSSCGVQNSALLSVMVSSGSPGVTNPVSIATGCDANASMSVTASGSGPFTYQWFKDGARVHDKTDFVSGSDGPTLAITNAIPEYAGIYTCTVSNACGNVTSGPATMTVTDTRAAITQSPVSRNICPGTTATLNGAASGTGPIVYEWQRLVVTSGSSDWVALADGTDPDLGTITGSNTQSLTVNGMTSRAAGSYRLKVSNICGCDYSNEASLYAGCPNVADIVGPGGVRGCDGQITSDDLIAFLAGFFGQTSVGDVASVGGSTDRDGQWTADDIIAFLAAFFHGCS